MNVLICEDSISISRMLAKMVENFGYRAIVVNDGESVAAVVKQADIDLVLMDVELPGMSGFEVTKALRDQYKAWFPIIFLTAKNDASSLVQGIENGGDDYLTKPVIADILAAKLKAMERLVDMKAALDKANKDLVRLSLTDQLTDVLNRRAFNQRLLQVWQRAMLNQSKVSVALIDIDHFKLYNDHYGHMKGDDCLKAVAQCIHQTVIDEDCMVARYGGEEFVILMPKKGLQEGQKVAQKVLDAVLALQIPHEKSTSSPVVSISVGVAEALSYGKEDYNLLTHNADVALYQAKDKGRSRVELFSGE